MADKIVNIDIAVNSADAASGLIALKRSLKELKDLQLQVGEGSADYDKISSAIGRVRDRINDANDTARVLAGNLAERLTSSFSRVAAAGVGAFSSVIAASTLFGEENENLQKKMVQLQALLTLTNGIKEFANIGQAAKDFNTVLKSLIGTTTAQAAATEGAAAATTTLNTALKANPAGIVLGTITLLIGALLIFTDSQKENTEAIKEAKKAEDDYKKSIDDTKKSIDGRLLTLENELEVLGKTGVEREKILVEQDARDKKRIALTTANAQEGLKALQRFEELRAKGFRRTTDEFIEFKNLESSELLQIGQKTSDELTKIEQLRVGKLNEIEKSGTDDKVKIAKDAVKKTVEDPAIEAERLRALYADLNIRQIQDQNTKELEILDEKFEQERFKFRGNKTALLELEKIYVSERGKLLATQAQNDEQIANQKAQDEVNKQLKITEQNTLAEQQLIANKDRELQLQQQYNVSQQQIDDLYAAEKQRRLDENLKTEDDLVYASLQRQLQARQEAKDKTARIEALTLLTIKNSLTTINNLAELFAGKSRKQQERAFKVQKAASIAQTLIDTYQSAQASYKSLANVGPAGPILGAIAAAAAITAGLINVKKIKEQKFSPDGGASGSASAGGSAPPAISTTTISSASSGLSSGIASALPAPATVAPQFFGTSGAFSGNQPQPVRAFVVESELTDAQLRAELLRRRTTL